MTRWVGTVRGAKYKKQLEMVHLRTTLETEKTAATNACVEERREIV